MAVVGMNGIIEKAGNLLADYMAVDPDTEFEISEFTSIKDMTTGNPDLMMTVSFLPTHMIFYVVAQYPCQCTSRNIWHLVMGHKNIHICLLLFS